MIVAVIILLTNLFILLILHAEFQSAGSLSARKFFGSWLPPQARQDPGLLELSAAYKKGVRRQTLLAVFLNLPFFLVDLIGMGFFMLYYTLWLALAIGGYFYVFSKSMRSLFELKRERGWFDPQNLSLYSPEDGSEPFLADDDQFWLKGWYKNPQDEHILAPQKIPAMNMGFNLGNKTGRILNAVTWGVTAALMLGLSVWFLFMDFAPYTLEIRDEQVIVDGGGYGADFSLEEITALSLEEKIPEVPRTRTNGAETDSYLLGNFDLKGIGRCRLFYYVGYSPVIRIETEKYTVFFNTKDSEKTEKIYKELKNTADISTDYT
ncbi:MAG: PH domain-containing protein [Candidatus Limivivens sp.]|nr:PH domain-containing protein [Candidatus Limivivens sp.]